MDEKTLRTRLIEERKEQDIAIKDNERVIAGLVDMLEKVRSLDTDSLYVLGADLSFVHSIDINRLSSDGAYIDKVKADIENAVTAILEIVEKELV